MPRSSWTIALAACALAFPPAAGAQAPVRTIDGDRLDITIGEDGGINATPAGGVGSAFVNGTASSLTIGFPSHTDNPSTLRGRTVLVRAGRSYLARARRAARVR